MVGLTLIDWQTVFYSFKLCTGQIRVREGFNTRRKPHVNTVLKILIRILDMDTRYGCEYGSKLDR